MDVDWPSLPKDVCLEDIGILADWFADQQNTLYELACRCVVERGYVPRHTPHFHSGEPYAWGLRGCPPAWKQADLPASLFYRLPGVKKMCRAMRYDTLRDAYVGLIEAVASSLADDQTASSGTAEGKSA